MSLHAFNLAIDEFLDKDVPEFVTTAQRALAAEGLRRVVLKSPVDKGRFRSAWEASLNEPDFFNPPIAASYRGATETIAEGLAVIAGATPFGIIYIQNNVEYSEALEGGHSQQAPAGVLAVTVAELESVKP